MLRNSRFSAGWYHPDGIPELQIPEEWFFTDYTGVPNPIDPAAHSAFVRPEVRVLSPAELPPAEWPEFVSPENRQVLKAFKGYGAWYSGLSQAVALTAGDYVAIIEVFPDLVDRYEDGQKVWATDSRSARARVLVDGQAATDWAHLIAGSRVTLLLPFTTDGGNTVRFEFMLPFPLNNAGLFVSRLDVERSEPIPPGPPPAGCRGAPRAQYERTYNVIPGDVTETRAVEIFLEGWRRSRETAGGSYDDAGVGDLDERIAILHDIPLDLRPDFVDFYETYYPGVEVRFPGDEPPPPPPPTLPISVFNQCSEPWRNVRLGASGYTMCSAGCAVVSAAMIGSQIDKNTNPLLLVDWLNGNGGFYNGLLYWAKPAQYYDLQFVAYHTWRAAGQIADMTVVRAALARGPVIIQVDYNPADDPLQSHFVVALREINGDIEFADPMTGTVRSLQATYWKGSLAASIKALVDYRIPEAPPPPPPPPTTPIRPANTRGTILLHWTPTTADGVEHFMRTIRPPAVKVVTAGGGGGELKQAGLWSPDTLLVHRRVENDLNRFDPTQAAGFVQRYIADLSPHFDLADFSRPPIYIVSGNEWYECGQTQNNIAAANWDIAFMDAIEATGLNMRGVVYTAPVGNPHVTPADLDPLLPMVAKTVAGKHLLGKHCYYASVPSQPLFYQESWRWYGGRFAEDDAYFASKGLRANWLLGEGGSCEATIHPGGIVTLNPGAGWKSCGSIQRYRDELLWCNEWYTNWNANNGGRLLGVCLFTTGGWGWEMFELQGADLDVVTNALVAVL